MKFNSTSESLKKSGYDVIKENGVLFVELTKEQKEEFKTILNEVEKIILKAKFESSWGVRIKQTKKQNQEFEQNILDK